MSDETSRVDPLVKRLREASSLTFDDWTTVAPYHDYRTAPEAADIIEQLAANIEALTAKCEALGQEVNMAKYGQPDFAWSIHVEAMAEAKERAEAAEKKLQEMQAHIDHADAYHKAMLAAVAEHARLRAELTKAADSLDWADAHLEDAGVVSANVRYGARDARAALTGNVTVGGGWVDWGASFLPAVPTGKADT